MGFVTVVWNDACEASVFHMDVILPQETVENTSTEVTSVLTTVACGPDSGIDNCLWVAQVQKEIRDEHDDTHDMRRYAQSVRQLSVEETEEAAAKNEDIALLMALMAGDADAHAHFNKHGGRRRLDDGSTVKVLWLYSNTSKAAWGDSSMISQITAAIATANQALTNSNAGFVVEGSIQWVDYTEVSQTQALTDLNAGVIPGYATLRNTYQADVVQLIVESCEYCGYGSVMAHLDVGFASQANSVVCSGCLTSFSHIHEIGHNMGLLHDRTSQGVTATADSGTDWPYDFGYRQAHCCI
ncbi:hypothetical protein JKP88DRAFT_288020 [Tribonema minus]|uniref:Uncharacterized protein n=1 Tax=Tribonema minus TaxID=303371 RepID=A0A835Z8L3_9STRA|nr:hypothetical protein JKP88DRAFT_288020 [Tribonema minus]